ncbi:general substrate transporter [Bisporella sp. PMI_857]|nr:general substrate transporter [Bisporella sp. PMI_857]
MGAGGIAAATADTSRVEAPTTWKSYLMCVFAAFGGIFFGYDSGYISGVLAMDYFIYKQTGQAVPGADASDAITNAFVIPTSDKSLIVSILSAGTFFGAIIAGDLADWFGRRTTVILGCFVYSVGVVLQTASDGSGLGLLVTGRLVAGFGVGFVSAIIILYMSEIAPKAIRGAVVSGYQFAITIGLLLASCVDYGTQNRLDTGAFRIPIAVQFLWAIILAAGLFWLPESPRYFVKKGDLVKATAVLERLRDQPKDSIFVQEELAEIVANYEYEMSVIPQSGYFSSWANCFKGGLRNPASNLRRTILGTSLQMMQQWTGVNFIFYFGTTFFTALGTISNPFLISLITSLVNVCSTPLSFYIIEKLGRRTIMIWGALGMVICQFIVAILGVTVFDNDNAVKAMIAFICIYIFFFATTWGPGAWVVIGEIFPLPIRSRGVGLSTASNWLWNCIIAIITPYLTSTDNGGVDLGPKIFFLWGSLCVLCFVYAYVLIPETKGLTLEQVDRMMEETTPRQSSKWTPKTTFAEDMGYTKRDGSEGGVVEEKVEDAGKVV